MLATPLQMAMVAAAIANKGVEMKPTLDQAGRLARRLDRHSGCTRTCCGRRRSPTTAGAAEGHDGRGRPGRHRHRTRRSRASSSPARPAPPRPARATVYDAWFIFFAPADNPTLAGAVVVENQQNGFGGAVAAPIAKQLMQAILPPASNEHGIDHGHEPPKTALIGTLFDRRYLIERKLGSGGMADVYLAEDEELGRKVALKMLNERHARDEQFVERFKREAQNAAGLNHPHIVRIFDRGQAEGTYYIAMEYLDGPTLKELLVRKGPTPPLTAIEFAREILSALA